jgi:hypothetical protein
MKIFHCYADFVLVITFGDDNTKKLGEPMEQETYLSEDAHENDSHIAEIEADILRGKAVLARLSREEEDIF